MSKSTWRLLLLLAIIVLVIWYWRSKHPPDARLAAHFDDICDIAEDHADDPSRGVDLLFEYLGDNSPDMMEDVGDLLVLIERIPDDARHDERAQEAAQRLREPLLGCAAELQRFGQAIENDPEASAKFQRGIDRLARTLQILVGQQRGKTLRPTELLRFAR
jgi:hypothetical protein